MQLIGNCDLVTQVLAEPERRGPICSKKLSMNASMSFQQGISKYGVRCKGSRFKCETTPDCSQLGGVPRQDLELVVDPRLNVDYVVLTLNLRPVVQYNCNGHKASESILGEETGRY